MHYLVFTYNIASGSSTTKEALGGFSCYPDCGANDQSVPIYNAYNHHYFSWLVGSDAKMYEREEATFLPNPTKTGFQTKVGFGNLVGYLGSVLVNQPTVQSWGVGRGRVCGCWCWHW